MTERTNPSRSVRKVLIVEDDDDTRTLLTEHFERLGLRAEMASNGNEGIALALRTPPDVIILDLVMPQLDGWDTARLLRAYPTTATIPVIVCTGVTSEEDLKKVTDLGCVIVKKPCSPQEVERVVYGVLGRRRSKAGS